MESNLKLDLDELSVDSFEATPEQPEEGVPAEAANARTCQDTNCYPWLCCA